MFDNNWCGQCYISKYRYENCNFSSGLCLNYVTKWIHFMTWPLYKSKTVGSLERLVFETTMPVLLLVIPYCLLLYCCICVIFCSVINYKRREHIMLRNYFVSRMRIIIKQYLKTSSGSVKWFTDFLYHDLSVKWPR